jgi:hypothetical protein
MGGFEITSIRMFTHTLKILALGMIVLSALTSSAEKVGNNHMVNMTVRSQSLAKTGRVRWTTQEEIEMFNPQTTAILISDMWQNHWCKSATPTHQSHRPDRERNSFRSSCEGIFNHTRPQRLREILCRLSAAEVRR